MIVKFFKRGTGSGSGPVDYLLGRKRDRELAEVLRGHPEETVALIDSSPHKKKYTSGVLNFEEMDVTYEQKLEIMRSFEKCLFPGMDANQFSVLWVEHTDKGKLELNFVVPNIELQTGKCLQAYVHRVDKKRVDAWKNLTNIKYGFTDPNCPEKKQALTLSKDLPRDKKLAAEKITKSLNSLISMGDIENRDDLVKALEEAEINVVRQTKSSISIEVNEQRMRLTGAIYERDFECSREFREEITRRAKEYRADTGNRAEEYKKTYESEVKRKREYLGKRHKKLKPENAGNDRKPEQKLKKDFNSELNASRNNNNPVNDRSYSIHEQPVSKDSEPTRNAQPIKKYNSGNNSNQLPRGKPKENLRENRGEQPRETEKSEERNLHNTKHGGLKDDRNREIINKYCKTVRERSNRGLEDIRGQSERSRGTLEQLSETSKDLATAGRELEQAAGKLTEINKQTSNRIKQIQLALEEYSKKIKNSFRRFKNKIRL